MSYELPEWVDFENVSVCLKAEYDSDDQIIDIFNKFNQIDFPPKFNNRIEDIDEDDPLESSIAISDVPPRKSIDRHTNLIFFNIERNDDKDPKIHVHTDFEWELNNEIERVLTSVLGILGGAEVEMFRIDIEIDYPLSDLLLPIKESSVEEVVGIRLKADGSTYIIQEKGDGTRTDIRHTQSEAYFVDAEESEFMHTKILSVLEYVRSLVP